MSRKTASGALYYICAYQKNFYPQYPKTNEFKNKKTLPSCKGHDIAWIRDRSRAAIAGKDRRMRISIHFLQYGEFIKRLTRNQALRRNALVKTSEVVSAEKGES